jgi:uncharacterized surface protein with fasciclin (FAS1) repeats
VAAALLVTLAACGESAGGSNTIEGANPNTQSAVAGDLPTSGDEFGPVCADLPSNPYAAGSLDSTARVPVGTAVETNSLLLILADALRRANLTATLNGLPAATVFLPTDDAFGRIPKPQLEALTADPAALRKVLTYQVVPGRRIMSDDLTAGPLTTMQGSTLTVTGEGQDLTVNGTAHVVCGNVQTTNATVYFVDAVPMPPSS